MGNSEVHTLPYPDGVVLPTGYERCEYIESNGTQWINTGVVPKTTLSVKIKYNVLQLTEQNNIGIFGSVEGTNGMFSGAAGSIYYINNTQNALQSVLFKFNTVREEEYIDNAIIRDGVTYTTNPIVENNISMILFGRNTGSIIERIGNLRIYYFTLYDNGVLIQNLIPARRNSDNVLGMYDTVTGNFLTNVGTGTFDYKLYPQPTEIWSCGEYNATDGKYHILVQPQGGSIADIALDAPLRKVNNVADTIEFPSSTDGKALVTRNLGVLDLHDISTWSKNISQNRYYGRYDNAKTPITNTILANILSAKYTTISFYDITNAFDDKVIAGFTNPSGSHITFRDTDITDISQIEGLILYELVTPTTELVDAPQIAEADSYSCVISQGAKAVEWSDFETDSE